MDIQILAFSLVVQNITTKHVLTNINCCTFLIGVILQITSYIIHGCFTLYLKLSATVFHRTIVLLYLSIRLEGSSG